MDGSVSTIVPYLEKGTLASFSRYWADYVITEWGVDELTEAAENIYQASKINDFLDIRALKY